MLGNIQHKLRYGLLRSHSHFVILQSFRSYNIISSFFAKALTTDLYKLLKYKNPLSLAQIRLGLRINILTMGRHLSLPFAQVQKVTPHKVWVTRKLQQHSYFKPSLCYKCTKNTITHTYFLSHIEKIIMSLSLCLSLKSSIYVHRQN